MLSADEVGRGRLVRVVPLSSKNYTPAESIAVPPRVSHMPGLTGKSWIVPIEVNRFIWTGPDVVPTRSGGPYFGKVPRALFDHAKEVYLKRARPEIYRD